MQKYLAMALLLLLVFSHAFAASAKGRPEKPERVHGHLKDVARKQPNRTLEVLIHYNPADAAALGKQIKSLGGRALEQYPFINTMRAEIPANKVDALSEVASITWASWNAPINSQAVPDASNVRSEAPFVIGADYAWSLGYDGTGVTVAVVDSGFTNAKAAEQDMKGRIVAGRDVIKNASPVQDHFGHGTHVAGIIGGSGASASGRYPGIAPGAKAVIVKASTNSGQTTEADLIKALQWVFDNRERYGIRVVNLSVSSSVEQGYRTSPLNAAVQRLWFAGVTVVASAGNHGPGTAVNLPPSNDPFVIVVGAIDDKGTRAHSDDALTSFSTYGTTTDGYVRPDVYAPGKSIISLGAGPGSTFHKECPTCIVDSAYFRLSGTSMSAPMVSGFVALLLQANPELTPDQVKWLIQNHQRPFVGQPADGPGILDGAAALQAAISGAVGTANQGIAPNLYLAGVEGADWPAEWDTAYWNTAYWNTAYWNTAYWNAIVDPPPKR